ncbi:MspA family porin [Mycolicibacterium sp. 050158]|jgi:MspA|uniref:MspA family porin n=1 Tax=Mycolicibacterium sp. 050158 TaxID=3090602 RepID=UPI00299F2028|nr:MspA family porin [Mycolicibacterium sp. 050158]MDX1889647.1 MspA family porin [Mycolicibacterium sp. 050158]
MFNRFALLATACVIVPMGAAPLALADPPPDPAVAPAADAGPPPDNGIVGSSEPGVVTTPDGWTLTVAAANETELPVAPLTTALSSREYLVGGTFTGTVTGSGKTKLTGGTLEAGYQIGCGIELGQVRLIGQAGIGLGGLSFPATGPVFAPALSFPLSGTIEIHPKPGTVSTVTVDKKSFKAAPARVTLKDTHIKVDGCVGQSFLRSYATLTSSTTDTDDVVAYYGITKAV